MHVVSDALRRRPAGSRRAPRLYVSWLAIAFTIFAVLWGLLATLVDALGGAHWIGVFFAGIAGVLLLLALAQIKHDAKAKGRM